MRHHRCQDDGRRSRGARPCCGACSRASSPTAVSRIFSLGESQNGTTKSQAASAVTPRAPSPQPLTTPASSSSLVWQASVLQASVLQAS